MEVMETCKYCRKNYTPKRPNYPHCNALECALEHTHRQREIEWMQGVSNIQFQKEFNAMVALGTKAWADVPNGAEWVDELRGNTRCKGC
jgi:hypothetical protein